MKKLILWDIDGTLLYSGGVAGEAMRTAMRRVYGRSSDNERRQYAGKTDQQIILETFADRDPDELLAHLDQFTVAYLEELAGCRDAMIERARVLEGVLPALESLAGQPVVQSVLTGNLAPVAHYKLDLMGIAQFFDLDVGAYGSDHHQRTKLVPIAAERAHQRYGQPFVGSHVVIIGDTPNDVACGRAAGARTVAVATGPFNLADLQACAPDAALANLADTNASVNAILADLRS